MRRVLAEGDELGVRECVVLGLDHDASHHLTVVITEVTREVRVFDDVFEGRGDVDVGRGGGGTTEAGELEHSFLWLVGVSL